MKKLLFIVSFILVLTFTFASCGDEFTDGIKETTSWEIKDKTLEITANEKIGNFCASFLGVPSFDGRYDCKDNGSIPWKTSDFNTVILNDKITVISSHSFNELENLEKVIIKGESITAGHAAFYNCKSLKTIENFDSINKIEQYAFASCESLEKLEFSNNLEYILQGGFDRCVALKEIYVPNSLYRIDDYAFARCSELKSVKLYENSDNGNNDNNVSFIGNYAFGDCENLEEVYLPNSIKRIDIYAFNNCTSLNKINLPESLEVLEAGAFNGCTALKDIFIDNDNKNFVVKDGVLYTADMKNLVLYPDGKDEKTFVVPDSVEKINESNFKNCTNLEEVYISENVVIIYENAFSNCKDITIFCKEGSVAHQFAVENNLNYEFQ